MLAKKTIKAKILELRKGKQQHLEREYANFQLYLHGNKMVALYSATKQQAERFLKRIKRPKEGKEYPLILRNDVYRIDRSKARLTEYWLKVPISNVRGGIFLLIKPHTPMPDNVKFGEAKIIRKKGEWFVYITVEAEVAERRVNSVLAVDVGVHNIAATVNSKDPEPRFYGKALRQVRGHCGLNLNADWNGARNILKRALGHVSSAGAAFDTAEPRP